MQAHGHHSELNHNQQSWLSRHRWISYLALAAIAYYLLTEHRQHVYAFLPFLFLALCAFMHVFMHGGHGGHGGQIHDKNHSYRQHGRKS